jgi:hypothetical protein
MRAREDRQSGHTNLGEVLRPCEYCFSRLRHPGCGEAPAMRVLCFCVRKHGRFCRNYGRVITKCDAGILSWPRPADSDGSVTLAWVFGPLSCPLMLAVAAVIQDFRNTTYDDVFGMDVPAALTSGTWRAVVGRIGAVGFALAHRNPCRNSRTENLAAKRLRFLQKLRERNDEMRQRPNLSLVRSSNLFSLPAKEKA